ncbi:uncharacterized protein METZ01_LOCUS452985 [marine metagenome]|uniref:Uncharacterized protein n=1 Tax=marine metagenome TaxID=408172 RepID=A0A382ZXF6_9ZZZZ
MKATITNQQRIYIIENTPRGEEVNLNT